MSTGHSFNTLGFATLLDAPQIQKNKAPTPTNAASNAILPRVISAFKGLCTKEIGYNIFQRGYYDHIIIKKLTKRERNTAPVAQT